MRTIQPKILEIPGVKWNGKKTSREKFVENLAIPRDVDLLLEILENAVPFATGSCRTFKADVLMNGKRPKSSWKQA